MPVRCALQARGSRAAASAGLARLRCRQQRVRRAATVQRGAILRAMSGEGEAAGDVLTGAIVAGAIEGTAGKRRSRRRTGANASIAARKSPARTAPRAASGVHLHRSFISLGHDILHGVFHFEGKMWRTIPELFFHPGRLTRRYIDGERAKFVSPMALYLFTVFLMFGVFSFTTSNIFDSTEDSVAGDVVEQWKENNATAQERTQDKLDAVREELEGPGPVANEARGAGAQAERPAVGAGRDGRAGERRLGRAP